MNFRLWYSTESFADFIIDNTIIKNMVFTKKEMYESDASKSRNFHTMPDHIKKILYLDAPDLIVEIDNEPVFSVEVTTEAGTGHNAFQRYARLAAAVENNVPAFYIYPEAAIIHRNNAASKWDSVNPLVFKALEDMMSIYSIPALLYYFPSDYRTHPDVNTSPNYTRKGLKFETAIKYSGCPLGSDPEMQNMFTAMDDIINIAISNGVINGKNRLLAQRSVINQRSAMNKEYNNKGGNLKMSPLSATEIIPTDYLLNYLKQYEDPNYHVGELLRSRGETVVYKIGATFRGDPYPGALAAIDYLLCRQGKSFEERKYNLVLIWGNLDVDHQNNTLVITGPNSTIDDFVKDVQKSEKKNILSKDYSQIQNYEIPRYYMQVRYGSTYSKNKHIRVFSYFADAILFPDGSLWRDA